MAYSILNYIDFGNTGSAASIVSGSYTLTVGSRVGFIAAYANGSDDVTTIADTNGNSWAKVGTAYVSAGGLMYNRIECKNVTVGGSTQITVNLGTARTHRGLAGWEISGLDNSAAATTPVGVRRVNPGAGNDAITLGAFSITGTPGVLLGLVQDEGNSDPITAGLNFNTAHQFTGMGVINGTSYTIGEDRRLTSDNSYDVTATSAFGATHTFIVVGMFIPEASASSSIAAIVNHHRRSRVT